MTIHSAQWLVDKRIIFAYAEDTLTNQEMIIHNERMIKLLDLGSPPVYVLLVTHPEATLPKPSVVAGRRILSFARHPNLSTNVVVHEPNTLLAKMSIILSKLSRSRYRQFGNIADALEYLKGLDNTIDWERADMSILDVIPDYPPSASNSV